MTDDPADYILPADENQAIFEQEIVPELLQHCRPQETPTAVVVVAQQGAGKSRTAKAVADVLNTRGGFVDVDSDLLKPFHPRYDELMQLDDQLMAAYTGPDGQAWMRQVQDYVRENRLNALIQETAQSPEYFEETLQKYQASGFRVEGMFLGVPQAMSQQGVVHRYFEQVQENGSGRLSVPEKEARSWEGIPASAERVDEGRLCDEVAVFRRGEDVPRYHNALDAEGQWQHEPRLREAIETERQRPWTEDEARNFTDVQHKLMTNMGETWHQKLDDISERAKPLMNPDDAARLDQAREHALENQSERALTFPPLPQPEKPAPVAEPPAPRTPEPPAAKAPGPPGTPTPPAQPPAPKAPDPPAPKAPEPPPAKAPSATSRPQQSTASQRLEAAYGDSPSAGSSPAPGPPPPRPQPPKPPAP